MPIEATLCHIIGGRKLLLKKANRGVSAGKWNGPGGKLERGETPEQSVAREVKEETSLRIADPTYYGKIGFYMDGGEELDYLVHVYLVRRFSGTPKSTSEGKLKWFDLEKIPYSLMWDDDRYWLPLLLNGVKFDASFYYDRRNRNVLHYEIRSQAKNLTGPITRGIQ